ncbi:hypothetical protein PINS_up006499 [Pythium insidiosum]|nr:hypothetical protein PINS_up006499 [Pythium insidiosum]
MPLTVQQHWLQAASDGDVDRLRWIYSKYPELLNVCASHQSHLKASTALHLCAWRNHRDAASLLLSLGANVDATDEAGMTPLQIAVLRASLRKMRPMPLRRSVCGELNSPPAVRLARLKRSLTRERMMMHPSSNDPETMDTSTLEVLLKYGAQVNGHCEIGKSALLLAVDDGLLPHTEILLAHGADVYVKDAHGRMALDLAAERGHRDVVELLLSRYPELLGVCGERALRQSVCHELVDILELLYDPVMRVLPDDHNRRELSGMLLHTAVEYDAASCATFLLDHGVPVDWTDAHGETAVHVACRRARPQMLEMLFKRGANGEIIAHDSGRAPCHVAVAAHGANEIVVLASVGTSINLFDSHNDTPLTFAAKNNYPTDLMECLIDHGAHFLFRDQSSRDSIAPVLTAWLIRLSSPQLSALVDRLLSEGCVMAEPVRTLLASLTWTNYTPEALELLFLALFSAPPALSHKACDIFSLWLHQSCSPPPPALVKLLHDALRR